MSVETRTHHEARCPRCGYDLRGTIETWKCDCPIYGICNECGLEFEWGELLCPRRAVPRWCVEYARGPGMASTAILTVLMLYFRPLKFWRDLKMTHKPHWMRFSALALLVLILLYLSFALFVGYETYTEYRSLNRKSISTPFHPVVYGLYATINPYSNYQFTYTWTVGPNTKAKPTSSPRGTASWIVGSLYQRHFWKEVRRQIRGNHFAPSLAWMRMSVVIVHGLILVALCPLAFVALPQSLRKAKVRWQHLVRIALYSSFIILPPLGLYIHEIYDWRAYIFFGRYSWDWFVRGSLIYILAGLIIWWSLAAKHYLKLPHAWWVGISMVVLAYAVGLFLVSFFDFVMM